MKILTSWRTSLAGVIPGVGVLLIQIGHLIDSDPKTVMDMATCMQAISVIMIGLTARDNLVSSRTAGAK